MCHTERDGQAGQSQAYQQHHQEEEVGAGGSERTCGWTAVVDQRHLFNIEDKEVFHCADGRQHRAVERADPADGLTVDDLQHVLRDGKLLLAKPLRQAAVTVLHYQLSGKLHKDGDCKNDDEVKDGEFVHLLSNAGLPTRVKHVVIATQAWLIFTFSDLRPEREEENPDAGQPHEDTPHESEADLEGRRVVLVIYYSREEEGGDEVSQGDDN